MGINCNNQLTWKELTRLFLIVVYALTKKIPVIEPVAFGFLHVFL